MDKLTSASIGMALGIDRKNYAAIQVRNGGRVVRIKFFPPTSQVENVMSLEATGDVQVFDCGGNCRQVTGPADQVAQFFSM